MAKRILIITTNLEIFDPISVFLAEMGYKAFFCDDPRKAQEVALQCRPDLVLCQVSMPAVTGQDLAMMFKANKKLQRTPFLLLVTKGWMVTEFELPDFTTEADDLVQLPFNQTELYGAITRWLESDTLPLSLSKKVAEPEAPSTQATREKSWRRGRISLVKIAHFMINISKRGRSGSLVLKAGHREMTILVNHGLVVDVQSNYIRRDSLGQVLIRKKKIASTEKETSFAQAKKEKMLHGRMLVNQGVLTKRELNTFLAAHKESKILGLFDGTWEKGAFRFNSREVDQDKQCMKPVSFIHLLKLGIFEIASLDQLYGLFVRNKKQSLPMMMVRDHVEGAIKFLDLEPAALEFTHWINGKSIEEVQNLMSQKFD